MVYPPFTGENRFEFFVVMAEIGLPILIFRFAKFWLVSIILFIDALGFPWASFLYVPFPPTDLFVLLLIFFWLFIIDLFTTESFKGGLAVKLFLESCYWIVPYYEYFCALLFCLLVFEWSLRLLNRALFDCWLYWDVMSCFYMLGRF